MAAGYSVNTKDLERLHKAFRRLRVRLPEAAEKELAKVVGDDAQDAARFAMSRPGARGKYKREPEAYGHVDSYKGDPAITIERGGTAIGAEFGTTYHTVFGTKMLAKSMRRRVFGARTGRGRLGKVAGKTAEKNLPKTERRVAVAFDKEAEREFRRQGL